MEEKKDIATLMNEQLVEHARIAEKGLLKLDKVKKELEEMIAAQKEGQSPICSDVVTAIAIIQETCPEAMGCMLKPALRAVRRSQKWLNNFVKNVSKLTGHGREYPVQEED